MRLLEELKRRNVIRVAIGYLAVSWLLLQAGSLVFGALDLPNSVLRGLLALLVVTFIPVLVFAWVYELTPEGLKRTSDVDSASSVAHLTGRKLDYILIAVLAAIVALLLVDKFVVSPGQAERAGAKNATVVEISAAPAESGAKAATTPNGESIAVLPFVDMSQAKDQEYFSDGLSEELLDLLAKVPQLKVIARTSSFSFKGAKVDVAEIAKKLNVANVLEGSVRKSGNTLRITAQLIRTADSTHLWSDTYDRELTDIFKVQDEIAGAVVSALKLKLLAKVIDAGSEHQTKNIEAYNDYLIGRQAFNRTNIEGWKQAEVAYRRALERDPGYAAAWAGLSKSLNYHSDFLETAPEITAMKDEAIAAAEKAVTLAPDSAEGYLARSLLRATMSMDWRGAKADVDQAAALDPGSNELRLNRAAVLASFGDLPGAAAQARMAAEVDPLSDRAARVLGMYLWASGDIAAARASVQRALTINPESDFGWAVLGAIELDERQFEAARSAYHRAGSSWDRIGQTEVEHALGHEGAAQAALSTLIEKDSNGAAYQIAEVHAYLGKPDQAIEWLERAYAQRDGGLEMVNFDPLLKPLRRDPRFVALLKKLGLPP